MGQVHKVCGGTTKKEPIVEERKVERLKLLLSVSTRITENPGWGNETLRSLGEIISEPKFHIMSSGGNRYQKERSQSQWAPVGT